MYDVPDQNSYCCFINNLIILAGFKLVDVVLFLTFADSEKYW